ncbi:peptide-methionine (R)-S-oxide reductase [Phormidesmis priestleyi ULC007]|uniref:peptide-methionine (R)-S-oxide reductase n=1 Tax=Phormidesmis priestleyi ULC007 TaxID=1920490 RepID=A0A2T1D5C6_9CYAN|nr:peptide-methionine (R)-S-oxide reductase MsrB [Phormidesmis priestleyi]PSB15679.1 peptide-methionine (R)-S-oxide reductase [Phormidesmis priestleyi ULC007]PZO48373.1 MAG: peptide-methionine (R)-S-oxide reductase [Phormidesmis priestleyi]
MKKRTFLLSGTAIAGAIVLLLHPFRKSPETKAETSKFEITKSEEEWRKILTPAQFQVLRKHGTERASTSPLDKQYAKGTYRCAACNLPLFTSQTKFNSGTGWPSFYAPIENAIKTTTDRSLFIARTEVHCRRCGGHLGHVFEDGSKPTGQRYCMNGAAMKFVSR